jgi:hypothetical protein
MLPELCNGDAAALKQENMPCPKASLVLMLAPGANAQPEGIIKTGRVSAYDFWWDKAADRPSPKITVCLQQDVGLA